MMKAKAIIALIVAAGCALAASAQSVSLHIVGDVDTTNHYTSIGIIRQNDMPRNLQAEIPVVDGKVDYVFVTAEPDQFELVALQDLYRQGAWMPMRFMSEDGELTFSSKIDDGLLNITMEGATGPLNSQVIAYARHKDQVYAPQLDSITAVIDQKPWEDFYTPEAKAFWEEFEVLSQSINEHPDSLPLRERRNEMFRLRDKMEEEHTMYTAEYYALSDAAKDVSRDQFREDLQNVGSADKGFFALSLLIDWFNRGEIGDEGKEKIIDAYLEHYQAPYANTIMGQRMDKIVTGYEISHIGGRYPNYSLPDAEGNEHQIKDLIDGKLVLIDLWGSTCGPCRVNSMSMKPIYEDYKDKGFEIVGIAREYGNLDLFHKAIEKDGYPWMQLIELDDAHGIFTLHGIPNAMGGTFLVSPEGRILLKDPTSDELRAFLADWYSENKL
ncbi:MAG: TlpA family protein disulfide reductase [Muribaculaceae bacterium]|nr:TlpA family protein disulfide reductase [Muribaculaceae bacterium]